jgi:DNA-binding CsgD family transcriptional regulator
VHQKPPSTNQKQRFNAAQKQRNVQSSQDKKDIRRKKLVKRSKSSMWVLLYLFITNESIISYKLNFTE